MATAAEVTLFLTVLIGIMHLFRVLPDQENLKMVLHAALGATTVLLLLVALATRHFSNGIAGLLALLATSALLAAGFSLHNHQPERPEPLAAGYLVLATVSLVLVLGSAGIGAFS
ncbi:MAG: hypothetical protein ACYDAG_12945 [Chloroflexota bacterium]